MARIRYPIFTTSPMEFNIVLDTFDVIDYRVPFQNNLPIATLKNVCLVSIEHSRI
jgi:hypothetical protein